MDKGVRLAECISRVGTANGALCPYILGIGGCIGVWASKDPCMYGGSLGKIDSS
jgi:hypothetical protein